MFANTITVTVNGAAKILTRVNQDKYSSEYRLIEAAQGFKLLIQHSPAKSKIGKSVDRVRVYLEQVVYATPTTPESVYPHAQSFTVTTGQDPLVQRNLSVGLNTLVNSTFLDALIQGEN